jgi:hypothetical protein
MSDTAYVATLPKCDFCKEAGTERDAKYDAKTVFGPWASMCDHHWMMNAASKSLGTGIGQRYVVGERPDDAQKRFDDASAAGDYDGMMEAVGDGDPADFM